MYKKEQHSKFRYPLLYIIVLNYNGFEDSVECIESLEKITYPNARIILVDNDSPDGSGERLAAHFGHLHYIQSGKNIGYAGGNNIGINYAMDNHADYICIVNNDVVVEKDFLEPIISIMQSDITIGIAGPKICEYNDRQVIQSTGAKINFFTASVPPRNAGRVSSELRDNIEVDYIGGACLVVRRSVIEKVGLIPEIYFLFFEETEWCVKAKKALFKIICICSSTVYHKGASAVSKTQGIQIYYMTRNHILFEKRNANWFQYLIFVSLTVMRYSLTFLKGLLTGKRDKKLFQGLIDGFRYKTDS